MDMETKTYYAEDMPTAMEQIKRELGVDAIIIKSRKIRQKYGPLGLFRRDMYEVVVSCEPDKSLPPARTAFNMDARLKQAKAQERKEAARREETRKADPMPSMEELLPKRERPKAEEAAQPKGPEGDPINIKSIQPERFAQLLELNASRQETPEEQEDMLRALSGSRAGGQPAAVSSAAKLGAYTAAMPERPARFIRPVHGQPEAEPGEAAAQPAPAKAKPAKKKGAAKKAAQREAKAQPAAAAPPQDDATMARLAALEAMMRELHDKMMEDAPKTARKAKPAKKKAEQEVSLESLMEALADQDVDNAALKALEQDARERMAKDKLEAREAVKQALVEMLGKPRCMRAAPKNRKKPQPRCILFVGPTGVGKTTTLVKLASTCVFERGAKVAIINADVFRVGAQDQLSAYARILNVPVSTIYDTGEIAAAVEAYKEHDFVFIDTSGKAPHDPDYQAELKKLIELGSISEIYLTASSTSSGRVCRQLAREYEGLGDYRVVVTKLDESGSYGSLVNLRYASGRPLSYITTGQNVPDDIKRAEPEDIAAELLG